MFYGSLDAKKEDRTYRKHYSADGTMEIKENTKTGVIEFITYLSGDGYSAPVVYKQNHDATTPLGVEGLLYLHRDYQGSILAITNSTGQVLEKRLFDAWGNIAKVQDGAGNTLNGLTVLDRGYTGHEHLQSVGLVHMNGRLYDPKLHRFLQPDNYVQDPSNTQNYNRYGYCMNSPLKYTDPSGEFIWMLVFATTIYGALSGGLIAEANNGKFIDGAWKGGVVGAIGGATGQFGGGTFLNNVLWGAASGGLVGGVDAALNGRDIANGIFSGALAGGVFAGISSGVEMVSNYRSGYGFRTDSGVVQNLVEEANLNGAIDGIKAQRAIDYVKMKYGMHGASMTYDSSAADFGVTNKTTGNISIGPKAFTSDAFLKATTIHELGHSILDRVRLPDGSIVWKYPTGGYASSNTILSKDGPLGYAQEIYNYGKMNMGLSNFNSIRSQNPLWSEWSKGWFSKTFSLLPMRFENKITLKPF
jgi:RHS repeat-associated protein